MGSDQIAAGPVVSTASALVWSFVSMGANDQLQSDPDGQRMTIPRIAILALWCVISLMTAVMAAGPESSVTSDDDPDVDRTLPAATIEEGVGGRVTSASGAPVANVFVQARSLGGPRAIPDIAVMTDSAGEYFWKLTAGRYELTFMRDGRELVRKQVVVRPNELTRLDIEASGQR